MLKTRLALMAEEEMLDGDRKLEESERERLIEDFGQLARLQRGR